ncbi:ATP-binding protein [Sphaerisporangium sp. NPDC049002]|uniref:ATP-binding protein n=1 Tax=Sphaerisporangium sp. NPDC049002 TaxID=3155392 RepID=UPI0033E02148
MEASVGEARRWLGKILGDHPCRDDAVLLLSEIFTNAVRHAASLEIRVALLVGWDGSVQVTVADEGSATVPCVCRVPGDELTERGRGIHLIRAVSGRWGFTRDRHGCSVWFVLDPRERPREVVVAMSSADRRAIYQEVRHG